MKVVRYMLATTTFIVSSCRQSETCAVRAYPVPPCIAHPPQVAQSATTGPPIRFPDPPPFAPCNRKRTADSGYVQYDARDGPAFGHPSFAGPGRSRRDSNDTVPVPDSSSATDDGSLTVLLWLQCVSVAAWALWMVMSKVWSWISHSAVIPKARSWVSQCVGAIAHNEEPDRQDSRAGLGGDTPEDGDDVASTTADFRDSVDKSFESPSSLFRKLTQKLRWPR
ncbi:hypothetical protein BJY52DRAFT_226637 [Lactarius psammicola]|nr:hypothetical protein BJY52DRAFT_226637 [Lactarius psammicola]